MLAASVGLWPHLFDWIETPVGDFAISIGTGELRTFTIQSAQFRCAQVPRAGVFGGGRITFSWPYSSPILTRALATVARHADGSGDDEAIADEVERFRRENAERVRIAGSTG